MRFLLLILLPLTIAGCVKPNYPTADKYTVGETMTSQSVQRCRVLDAREVRVGAQPVRQSNPYYRTTTTTQTLGGSGAQTGASLGALLGAVAGDQLTDGSTGGQIAGLIIGAAVGTNAGAHYDRTNPSNLAIEYSVIQADGRESVIVQPWSVGDRLVPIGSTCRLVKGQSGLRVLPGEHLPGSVNAPKQTRIN